MSLKPSRWLGCANAGGKQKWPFIFLIWVIEHTPFRESSRYKSKSPISPCAGTQPNVTRGQCIAFTKWTSASTLLVRTTFSISSDRYWFSALSNWHASYNLIWPSGSDPWRRRRGCAPVQVLTQSVTAVLSPRKAPIPRVRTDRSEATGKVKAPRGFTSWPLCARCKSIVRFSEPPFVGVTNTDDDGTTSTR